MRTVFLGLAATLALAAQDSRADYSFAGTVVNSVTGAPVKGAEVTLVWIPHFDAAPGAASSQQVPMVANASTGASG